MECQNILCRWYLPDTYLTVERHPLHVNYMFECSTIFMSECSTSGCHTSLLMDSSQHDNLTRSEYVIRDVALCHTFPPERQ